MEDDKHAPPASERIQGFLKERPSTVLFWATMAVLIIVIAYWAIWPDSSPIWTGFGAFDEDIAGPRAKTLWDWLEMLIVPVALAIGLYWLNRSQKETELKMAEKARAVEREIAYNRQLQATLEAYYDRMTELLLNHELRESVPNSEVRSIARARTIAVVRSLDGERNRQLFTFLKESKLLEQESPVIDLTRANLSKVDLRGADLSGVNLIGVDLIGANLEGANLVEANLSEAMLVRASLIDIDLSKAQLVKAILSGANLNKANLRGADLRAAYLIDTDLRGADLSFADLSVAQLMDAKLRGTDLFKTNLDGADLLATDLSGTDLSSASLQGTRMPDGVTLEDGIS